MSELLWTLSLLAQKHLAESPTVVPLPKPSASESQQASAQEQQNILPGKVGIASMDVTSPEFSAPSSRCPRTTQAAQAVPHRFISREINNRETSQPSSRLNQNHAALKSRKGDRLMTASSQALPIIKLAKTASPFTLYETSLQVPAVVAEAMPLPELLATISTALARPSSGSQLYAQRLEAIRQGKTYTRLPVDSFRDKWLEATYHPQYEDWLALLAREADAMAQGQGSNRLTVMIGDSLSQWFPNDQLPSDRFWLNQGISGDTSAGVLRRLSLIDNTRPDVIHVMVGINDLRAGATDAELLTNLQKIMHELHQRHPSAHIYVHSLLPTRLPAIPNDRITALNAAIAHTAQRENVAYLDLQTTFADENGNLRLELTTDGLHLSRYGYALWQSALRWFQLA